MKFVNNVRKADLENQLIHRHKYDLLLSDMSECKTSVFLAIYVLSERRNSPQRQIIRNTWGSVKEYKSCIIRVVFLLGDKDDTLGAALKSENAKHKDLIMGNFKDSYRNLTYKSIMGLHWVTNYCDKTRFVLKTDDDVMVNIYKLIHFLQEIDSRHSNNSKFLFCNIEGEGTGVLPIRNERSKFYIDNKEYSPGVYPPFCHGPGYFFSYDVARRLYESTKQVPLVRFEDVFMGFCAKVADIKPVNHFLGFYMDISNESSKPWEWTILKHFGRNKVSWNNAWQEIKTNTVHHSILYYKSLFILFVTVYVGPCYLFLVVIYYLGSLAFRARLFKASLA